VCKYETASLDVLPCCGTCVDGVPPPKDGEPWDCKAAGSLCRLGCLMAEWPYVYCVIE
jgi:hypothetical protein